MVMCRWKMAATAGWSNVYNTFFVVLSAYFFSTGDGQEPLCMGRDSDQILTTCVRPVMGALRWSIDNRAIEDILTTTDFWHGYCSGIDGLKACLEQRLDHQRCGDGDVIRFVQRARYDIAYRLATQQRKKTIYPVPEKVCNGYRINDDVTEMYRRTASGFFTQCITGEKVQECLHGWYQEAGRHYLRNRQGNIVKKMSRRELRRLTQKASSAHQCVRDETNVCDAGSQKLAMFIFTQTVPHAVKNNINNVLTQGNPTSFHNEGGKSVNVTAEHELNSILVPWEYWMLVQFLHEMLLNRD